MSAAIAKITGHQLHIRCALDEDGGGGSGGQATSPPPPAVDDPAQGTTPQPQRQQTRGSNDVDPKVRAVLDAFDGELV